MFLDKKHKYRTKIDNIKEKFKNDRELMDLIERQYSLHLEMKKVNFFRKKINLINEQEGITEKINTIFKNRYSF